MRRSIVDIDNCNTCHERVGFHSNAGRMNNPEYCAACHNPELSNSNLFEGTATFPLAPDGGTFYYKQHSNNFKDMIHSIHAAPLREELNPANPFNFIRGNPFASGGNGPMVFQEVPYPAQVDDCGACHKSGTYSVPSNDSYAWSVQKTQAANLVSSANAANFDPGLPDRRGPAASACASCHSDTAAAAHISANTSNSIGAEACNVCHGPGRSEEPHTN
jgi:OmcA/MtrC family decaheme c-type cytochrome